MCLDIVYKFKFRGNNMQMQKIGMRNIKTAVSVFLCLLIFDTIKRDNSFYACIAAIICMQPTLENTFKKGISRIIGTIIGGFLGAILLAIGETYITEKAYLFLIPIGIIILIEICVSLKQKEAVSICCVVFLSIMISHRLKGDYFWYTTNRIIDTSIGIIIAASINRYLKIPEFLKKFISTDKIYTINIEEDNGKFIK